MLGRVNKLAAEKIDMSTKIEWCEETWNFLRGCSKVSEGCQNCYALEFTVRHAHNPKIHPETREASREVIHKVSGHWQWTGEVRVLEHAMADPLNWHEPRIIFVCSMADPFHQNVPLCVVRKMLRIPLVAPQHKYLFLTKRPEEALKAFAEVDPPDNVWLGVTAENQKCADMRIPVLLQVPAAVRFVSCEPMLEPIDLSRWLAPSRLQWVICGAESGPRRRAFRMEWARGLKNQCVAAGVPFFLKQAQIDNKIVKMPELDGRVWREMPHEHLRRGLRAKRN